ncbi:MAG: family 78 glycoside hydrolase catalytic domain [Acidobacteriota bacterium]
MKQTRRQFLKVTGLAVAVTDTAHLPALASAAAPADTPAKETPNASGVTQGSSGAQGKGPLFSSAAKWIWDDSDRRAYYHYVQARCVFSVSPSELATLLHGGIATLRMTADANYQAWLNRGIVGAGPAKSAEGKRSVDTWPIKERLNPGENELLIVALSMGTGTETYCPDEAGLIFQLNLGGRVIASDRTTQVRPDPSRRKRTVRRWILPCIEDVDAAEEGTAWKNATEVSKTVALYPRRVPLPTRQVLSPQRLILADRVRMPNVSISLRLRPYLTDGEQKRRCNKFSTPAYLVSDVVSPTDQALIFTPTLGEVTWYFQGEELFAGRGWRCWQQTDPPVSIRLEKGANRLIGVHNRSNHFEDISLAGFAAQPVEFRNPFGPGGFQVVRMTRNEDLVTGPDMQHIDWGKLRPSMCEMDPADTMSFGNSYDLVYGAEPVEPITATIAALMGTDASEPFELPPALPGEAVRLIVDLGVLHNGWLSFEAEGREGSTLILAMFEGLEPGPPLRIQWLNACHNSIAYRLREGQQSFESFFPYGVRYIAVHHTGSHPVSVRNLRVLTANCGSRVRGSLLTDDELLNSIHRICAQSVISGVDDTFTDCPTYEQVNWNCDNSLAAQGDAVTCLNSAVAENTIELFAEDPRYPGLVRSQYPSSWEDQIPLWSFHWIMFCRDHYWRTGNLQFARRLLPRVQAGIEDALNRIGSRGLMEWPGVWHFIEWGKGRDDNHDIMSAEQAGLLGALTAAIELAESVDGSGSRLVRAWQNARRNLIQAVNAHLWDPMRGAYVDSLHPDGRPSPVSSQATNAAMVTYGVVPEGRVADLATRILEEPSRFLGYGSPYGLYYVLEMLDRVGDVESIFRIVRRRWGAMVLAGDTCTWETFPEFGYDDWPTRSRCHPFAAYVAKYFAKYLLGLRIVSPGYATFRVDPKPPAGLVRCHGSIPTPEGLIRIGWERKADRIDLRVEHPRALKRV